MKKIVSIILTSFALVSCVDTVLLPENKTVEEYFWQTKSDVAMMVNGAYAKMASSNVQQRLVVWTSRSDELNVNTQINNGELNQINSANIQTTNSYNSWNDLYAVINACNLVISKSADVMDIDPNYMEGDHLNNVGQMKALRALCYFYLVRVYRDVPLILEPYKTSSQNMLVPQEAPSIVIDQIIADLEEVKDNLLVSQSISDWTRCGYITRDGAYALLADVYLWKASVLGDAKSYDKCIECCEVIHQNRKNNTAYRPSYDAANAVDDDGYGLNPYYQYFYPFSQGNDGESIFELQFRENPGLCIVYNRYKDNSTQPQFFASDVYAKVSADANHVFNNTAYAKDVRGCESVFKFNVAGDAGCLVRKYVATSRFSFMGMLEADLSEGETSPIPNYSPFDQNWIFYRVTDVMLMKAEALVQKGLLYANTHADLVEKIETAATPEEKLEIANQLYEINQAVAGWNVSAARLAQIVNTRARIDASTSIDSAKYAVSKEPYSEGDDLTSFVTKQVATFNGLASTAATLETVILDERARELCFEGKRWFDMLRYNYRHTTGVNYHITLAQQGGAFAQNYSEMLKLIARKYSSGGGTGVTAKMPTEPYLYMPVLESEMDVNPLLVQNPVYQSDDTYEKNY